MPIIHIPIVASKTLALRAHLVILIVGIIKNPIDAFHVKLFTLKKTSVTIAQIAKYYHVEMSDRAYIEKWQVSVHSNKY